MISNLRQINSNGCARYVLETNGQPAGEAWAAPLLAYPQITLQLYGNTPVTIKPDIRSSIKLVMQSGTRRTSPWQIIDADGRQIGHFVCVRVGSFFSAYSYTELGLYDRVLQIYEVGLGKEGMRYPVYDGNIQLAQVEKSPVVLNNLDAYTLFSIDDFGQFAAVLYALYLDFRSYRNAGEYVKQKKSIQYVYTRRKVILSKYDPDFPSRC